MPSKYLTCFYQFNKEFNKELNKVLKKLNNISLYILIY